VSTKTNVKANAQAVPAAPTASNVNFCPPSAVTLTASGGSNGQYLWYDQNGLINGQTNNTFTTPVISSTTAYSVAITNGTCPGPMAAVSAVATASLCSVPVIIPEALSTQIGGKITLDLKPLISTPNSSLDLTSLQVVVPPSSGATASIDGNGILTITYTGLSFAGTDNITIKACDVNQHCAQQQFAIDVIGDIEIFNGISPNGANPKFVILYIDALPETKNNAVSIFDRWENLVWHGTNYDNNTVVFTGNSDSGNALPSGVYFYKIEFASGRSSKTGFISLRR
jgi:gliding motility-associated-like protein